MTAFGIMNSKHFSCSTAAAAAPTRMVYILDTALTLAVSICVLPLLRICRDRV